MRKTYSPKRNDIVSTWLPPIDANGATLGRLATYIVDILHNKHRIDYAPHMRMFGDGVIVVNADKMHYTGNKLTQKIYYHHTGYFGHLRTKTLEEMDPRDVLYKAIERMITKGPSRKFMLRRLRIFIGPKHEHTAQTSVEPCGQDEHRKLLMQTVRDRASNKINGGAQ